MGKRKSLRVLLPRVTRLSGLLSIQRRGGEIRMTTHPKRPRDQPKAIIDIATGQDGPRRPSGSCRSERRTSSPLVTQNGPEQRGGACVGAASLSWQRLSPGFAIGIWGVGSTESESVSYHLF